MKIITLMCQHKSHQNKQDLNQVVEILKTQEDHQKLRSREEKKKNLLPHRILVAKLNNHKRNKDTEKVINLLLIHQPYVLKSQLVVMLQMLKGIIKNLKFSKNNRGLIKMKNQRIHNHILKIFNK